MENKFTPEQLEKLKACQTAEEAKALAEAENFALTDEELAEVIGGATVTLPNTKKVIHCPKCSVLLQSTCTVCPKCGWRASNAPAVDAPVQLL